MNKDFWLVDIWRNGRCLDLWSVNHFLTGFLFGYFFIFIKMDLSFALLISLVLMIAWEIYEKLNSGTSEHICNKTFDVILGITGLFLVFWLFNALSSNVFLYIFFVSVGLFVILEIWGFNGYKRRTER